MATITIREQQKTATGFEATLVFENQAEYAIAITDPFSEAPETEKEQQLEWYFENWIQFPFTDTKKAETAAESVQEYGEYLFQQVFRANADAYSEYRQLRDALSQVEIEIVGKTPEFQALHWEALRDPDLPRPLAVECSVSRKHIQPVAVRAQVQPSPVINLLVVTARPNEEHDVGYRTISRPLIEAIQTSKLRVNVDLLRPGTYEALERHLTEKGEGFYHIIHFDAHGGLATFEQIQQQLQGNRHLYRYGRDEDELDAYEGVKAFLFLESDEKGKADPVEATELANLLLLRGIPVCILNACQSAKQQRSGEDQPQGVDQRETSLGSRLMTAGMQLVVAMGYSVTVSAAAILMEQLYSQLFAKKGITEAIRLGRRELFKNKQRRVYYDQRVPLEDWLLPVVYSNRTVDLNLRSFTPKEEETYYESIAKQYQFTQPQYGFVGRDLEILKIEKALLRHNMLLLRGMGGTGKTTLLNYLRQWWQTTDFAQQVFYFGYDQKAWTLEQILFELGKQVYDRFEQPRFQAMNPAAQVQKLVAKLRSEPYALILDNLESVTGQQLAIQNTLLEAERNQLRDFLAQLVEGKTRVVLGSRSGEEWLQAQTFQTNIYQLPGLDRESRTVLAEKILKRHVAGQRISPIQQDPEFARLMQVLAGYPLAMEVVLANLKQQFPTEILAALQAADVRLDVASEDKTQSILKCVEYSHSNLSADAQKLLLCLAPFSRFIERDVVLPLYIKELQKLEPFKYYAFDKFDTAIQEAINWGLLSPDANYPSLLTIQPIFPYFLKTKLEALDEATRQALREGFKSHYQGLAWTYKQLMDSKDTQERQLGLFFCQLEYENLYNALQICLEKQESISIFFCLDKYFELINDRQSRLKLAEMVSQGLEKYPPAFLESDLGYQVPIAVYSLATCYLKTQQYQLAKQHCQKTLKLLQAISRLEEREKQHYIAATYHKLGMVVHNLRELEEARHNYQQALEISIEYGDRYSQAATYHQLGVVAQDLRELEEARHNYQQALEVCIEFGDRHNQAKAYHELGRVAYKLREFAEARCNYQQALEIKIEVGDRYSQASTYHQLGVVAENLREFAQARRNFQQALEIHIEFDDRYEQADTYQSLGVVAQQLQEFVEARHNYQQALEIGIEYGDRYKQANAYHQLGTVAHELREFAEARHNYQQALEIYIEFKDRYEQAGTYHQLRMVAEELGELEEAKANYLQTFQIWAEFDDQYWLGVSLRSLARFYRATQDESLLAEVAQILGMTVEQIREGFESPGDS